MYVNGTCYSNTDSPKCKSVFQSLPVIIKEISSLHFTGLSPFRYSFMPSRQAQEKLPYRNPALPVEQRIADRFARMTLEKKLPNSEGTGRTTA